MIAFLILVVVLLLAALAGVILIWSKANALLVKYDAIDDVDAFRQQCGKETKQFQSESEKLKSGIIQQKIQLKKYMEVTGVLKLASEAKQKLIEFNSQLEVTRAVSHHFRTESEPPILSPKETLDGLTEL